MTERERICLGYLNHLMEATAGMIGEAIHKQIGGSTNYAAVGANIVVSLRRKGFVSRVVDLRAWRITEAGRAAYVDKHR